LSRLGLRKTGSFDKVRTAQKSFLTGSHTRQQETDRANKTGEDSASTVSFLIKNKHFCRFCVSIGMYI